MNQQIIWKQVNHPDILPGYLISPEGYIKAEGINDDDAIKEPSYRSTNGYDFMLLNNKDGKVQLFPIDDIIAMAYIPIPESLKDKSIKVSHINGDTRDVSLDNLQWVEDIEEWRLINDPDICQNMYEVSSWGRVRNIGDMRLIESSCKEYRIACLKSEIGKHIQRNINRLVATFFIPMNSPSRCIVNHIDGCKYNDYYKNLEWVTYSENSRHGYILGLSDKRRGSDSPSSKINENIAELIWLTLIDDPSMGDDKTNGSPLKVVEKLKQRYPYITKAIVGNIKKNRSWGNMHFDTDFSFGKYKLDPAIVERIWMLLIDDEFVLNGRPPSLGKPYVVYEYLLNDGIKVPIQKIYTIKNKAAWTEITSKLPQGNLKNNVKLINEIDAKKIWDMINDDPIVLNGRPKTEGRPSMIVKYLKDEIPNITSGIVYSIKTGRAWSHITGIKHDRHKHKRSE